MRNTRSLLALAAALLTVTAAVERAEAVILPACTAADIVAGDPSCPPAGPCTISKTFTVADGCILDFGNRDVTFVNPNGELRIGSGSVTLKANNFTMAGGLVDGTSTTAMGGFFRAEAAGNIMIGSLPDGKIKTDGASDGGTIQLIAGGNVVIDGQLKATNNSSTAAGGGIGIIAGGDVVIGPDAIVSVHGGNQAFGGILDVQAQGTLDVRSAIDAVGGDGGSFDLAAGGSLVIDANLDSTGGGDAGSGGDIDLIAGGNIEINARLLSKGTGSAIDSGGGDGGVITIDAPLANIIVRNEINAKAGPPDGFGGDIALSASGTIEIRPGGTLVAAGNGVESDGGSILVDAKLDAAIGGAIDASGGAGGGDIDVDAGRNIAIDATVEASGTSPGSFGGAIFIEAGLMTSGVLDINANLDAGAAGCDTSGFCSFGGDVDLAACAVTVAPGVTLDASAGGSSGVGGGTSFTARKTLVIAGTVDATGATVLNDGTNRIAHPPGNPPTITGIIVPAPTVTVATVCTGSGDPPTCLVPCPVCGNGITEFPETCDDTTGSPVSCDGCSAACRIENCVDGNPCTADLCDPVIGCGNLNLPDGTSCDDGDVCNGVGTCTLGVCSVSPPPNCDDANACTADACDPIGGCTHDPLVGTVCTDNDACTDGDACSAAGACVPGPQLTCADANECTVDSCAPASGCVFDFAPLIGAPCTDDGDPCTIDQCFGVCQHPPGNDGAPCEDGNLCTGDDTCAGGTCTPGAPVTCTALDQCHQAGICSPATGCSNPVQPDNTPCDDGNACTTADKCVAGVCTGGPPVVCAQQDQCHDIGTCIPATGLCTNPQKPDGAACSDGLFCTIDACEGGVCTPAPRDCGDTDTCTTDACDETADACVNDIITPCCGNGIVEPGEECDEGAANSDDLNSPCLTNCTTQRCGNGIVDNVFGEECDEGAANSNDPNATCRPDCLLRRCGDGVLDDAAGEQCDDGNENASDGCSPRCFIEPPAAAVFIQGGGSRRTDCILEWRLESPARNRDGVPTTKKFCADGEPCDKDGTKNGACEFHLWSCSNNLDVRLPLCQVGSTLSTQHGIVAVAEVRKPSLRQAFKTPDDFQNREELLAGASASAVGENFGVCGPRMVIRVPTRGPFRKGVKAVKMRGTTSRGVRDTDSLKFFCFP